MGKRTHFYFLFFLAWHASAAAGIQTGIIPPVVVSANKRVSRSITSGPKIVVTREQINSSGATTVAQALQNLGDVQLQDTSGNGSQVLLSMRGFGANASSNTLLLINGIPISNPDLAPPDLNAIPLQQIEYIEVVAGSESVLYGDQAVGGIINLVTRGAAKELGDISCVAGSYNQFGCFAALHKNYSQLNMNLAANSGHTDNYREHNDYDQSIFFGDFSWPYANGNWHTNFKVAGEDMQYPGALTLAQAHQDRRQSNNSTDFFKDSSVFAHAQNKHNLNSEWNVQTDFVNRQMHGHGVLFSPFTQSRMTYFLKPQLKGTINDAAITTGADYQNDNYTLNSAFGLTEDNQQKYGLFGLVNLPVYKRFSFSLGARGAQQNSYLRSSTNTNNINRATATTIGTTFQYSPDTHFYVRRAESFRFPKADENVETQPGVHGLKTQRGVAYEAGVEWKRELYSGRFGIYQLNLRDEITFDPLQTPQQPFGTNRNLNPTVRRGATLSGKKKLTNKLTLGGQYNYVNARFQSGINSGNRIPLVSENVLRASLNYKLSDSWNAYTEALFTGNQYPANDDANIAGKNGGYTTYNFNLGYHLKNLSASLRVNNIFNQYYYFYTVYQTSVLTEFFYPAPGRNFTLNLKYTFD